MTNETTTPAGVLVPAPRRSAAVATTPGSNSPAELLRIAVQSGADVDKLEQLMALVERHEANEARKAFVAAMAALKAEPLVIFKKQTVDFSSSKGRTHYKHANLADVTNVVGPAMAKHGLSYRWDVQQEPKLVTVTCIVTHELGHSERVTLTAPVDDSGNKNPIQMVGSTVQYLERYTLLAATGLATQNEHDDDGRSAGGSGQEEEASPLLEQFRAASLEGHATLRALYESTFNDKRLWLTEGKKLWEQHGASLKDAATKADDDLQAKKAPIE
jgi:hypothetical protein